MKRLPAMLTSALRAAVKRWFNNVDAFGHIDIAINNCWHRARQDFIETGRR
ncbi:MAG: hypothetical protein IPK95_02445 [Cellvibrionales bacterium]|nr:hypothetical protein [Cellvibrionales bacterium]